VAEPRAVCQTQVMKTSPPTSTPHRCPPELVSHAVWLSCRLRLSGREVEERRCTCEMMVTDEAIRQWCGIFGPSHAHQRRRRRPGLGDYAQLGNVVLTLHGGRHDLWRAMEQDDHVLDILVQRRRHKRAVKTGFKTRLKGLPCGPRVIITDQLTRDAAATGAVLPGVRHRQYHTLKNRYEPSHRLMRARERCMQWFTSLDQAQRLWSASGLIAQHVRPRRHVLSASASRQAMSHRVERGAEITGTKRAASEAGRTGVAYPCA